MNTIQNLAALLDDAARNAQAVTQISESFALSVNEAYQIQFASLALRQARGEQIRGVKMGFTSRAKAAQMGVDEVIHGWLTDAMEAAAGSQLDLSRFVHARVEPELAVRLGSRLQGKPDPQQAYAAIESVAPALEIIDSRYRDFKFSLVDVVADNSSSSAFVIGDWQDKPVDLSNMAMKLNFDGKTVQAGSTAEVLGDPVLSVVAAAEMLSRHGLALEAGWIILTGGATAAQALHPGLSVEVEVAGLGRTGFTT